MPATDPSIPLALVQPAQQPPELMTTAARAAEEAGLEELWLWEDCFYAGGVAAAAALLAATRELRVGIGLLPVPLRAPSLTAMEIATLGRMFPGRLLPGLGHGVLEWMGQAGVRVGSPLTLLREHVDAVGRLLAGEEVSTQGRYVVLDRVRLSYPPEVVPPVLVGGRGPRTLVVAGALGDGVILDDAAPKGRAWAWRVQEALEQVGRARREAGREGAPEVVVFLPTTTGVDADHLAEQVSLLAQAGATRVAAFAGGVDSPPGHGEDVTRFIPVLARARELLSAP